MPGDETIAVLNHSEHILFHRLLAFGFLNLLLRLVLLLQTDHLFSINNRENVHFFNTLNAVSNEQKPDMIPT